MNLKEAFRYQNFLEYVMNDAQTSISDRTHCLKVSNHHLRNKANPEADDEIEVVDRGEFYQNDTVIQMMLMLIEEKNKLSNAIAEAKASIGFNIDAALETNKFRQRLIRGVKNMMNCKAAKRKTAGRGYKFDVNQAQVPYIYDIEVTEEEDFDRNKSKEIMRDIIRQSDKISMDIEAALVNTEVLYIPPFDVNSTFDDVMQEFIAKISAD